MHAPLPAQPSRQEILALLRAQFGHRRFRPGQEEVLQAILTGRDAVAVLPTGAGKSLVFQIASQLLPGVTIVVSPLLALMRGYAETGGCGREYIMNYFGEAYDDQGCTMCDNSLRRSAEGWIASDAPEADGPFAVGVGVRHPNRGDGIVERVARDSITGLFDAVGFKMLDLAAVLERGVLEPVADRAGGR
jgi:hypothetical protein